MMGTMKMMTKREPQNTSVRAQRAFVAVATLVLLLLGTGLALAGGVWPTTPDPLVAGIRSSLSASDPVTAKPEPAVATSEASSSESAGGSESEADLPGHGVVASIDGSSPHAEAEREASDTGNKDVPIAHPPDDGDHDDDADEHETVGPEVRDDDEHEEDDDAADE
jgi:hypothetical protein